MECWLLPVTQGGAENPMPRFAVSTCHYLATDAAIDVLVAGGNVVDATVTAAFVLQVIEPHLNGPAGELVALIHAGSSAETTCVSGVGQAPQAADMEGFDGLSLIPATGVRSAPIPGQFHALATMLDTYGTISLQRALRPAASLALRGFPVTPSLHAALEAGAKGFVGGNADSLQQWLPRGVPAVGSMVTNQALGHLLETLISVANSTSRERGIRSARDYWYQGPVAEAIDAHVARYSGFLSFNDLAKYETILEEPIEFRDGPYSFIKAGAWTQGAVLPLAWATFLKAQDAYDPRKGEDVHALIECLRLAMADRDAYLGDGFTSVTRLLQQEYTDARAREVLPKASNAIQPGRIDGYEPWVPSTGDVDKPISQSPWAPERLGHGDTCQVSIIDTDGNGVSMTASGGWLQSSPVIPTLGFALSTRLQQMWLDPNSPSALAPGRRPRVTLSPTLLLEEGTLRLSMGSPGGDGQDQWQLHGLVRILLRGMTIAQAVSDYAFQAVSFHNSFWPRERVHKGVLLEVDSPLEVLADLQDRGHRVFPVPAQTLGRLSIASRDVQTGEVDAAASPRSGYASARRA